MGLIILLAQCVAMFIASMLAGSLPLMFNSVMTGKRLKAISVLGMGLLVGAALTIIIPEGINTLYSSVSSDSKSDSPVHAIGLSLLAGFALMLLIESLTPHPPHSLPPSPSSSSDSLANPLYTEGSGRPSLESGRPPSVHMNSATAIVTRPKRLHVDDGKDRATTQGGIHGLNATLGLVIHGAADGIALGASSLSERGSLGLIVFLAVMVHKGPTALGLTTTLLSLSISPPSIRKRLFIFSLAAPLGAILTYLLVKAFGWRGLGSSTSDTDGLGWWTGIALLFSGGSFLYVATVIQPLSSPPAKPHSHVHPTRIDASEHSSDSEQLGQYLRTGLLVIGMISPIVLASIVGDHD
ncbi:hypothetical protein TREMEDRAFT_71929 [Tremella mesenterica DSM 1558]|uniref:uncharacterized protein n=1 Tax=Tremella mesenterica (strain ATCC 24925 / CBS 8224 / DSM 1558 / NBRC 9311 / NRRL Y-6157 / RJB 2259-6 / UBC 559-6) TaxID=578456 RepID=UPI0003F49C1F|nr:uncharacterized protein TREMEDRAFT_71929 [Tremella mesenterica DSM 1558]EIW68171.1 hypothetical protein TREMEDRAFT_71929 [Tremella mesenterica DSM 1558]